MIIRLLVAAMAVVGIALSANAADQPLRTIYLIRHGQALTSQTGDDTVVNGLTPLGVVQAKLVASRLRGMPVEFTSLTASTFLRARQTGGIIHSSLPQLRLAFDHLLHETTPRTWQAEVNKGESEADLDAAEKQLNEAYAKYIRPADGVEANDIVVCHGNVIRYFVTKALGVDTKAWLGLALANCSLTIIQVRSDGKCRVLTVGDAGHIAPNLLSGWTRPEPTLADTPSS